MSWYELKSQDGEMDISVVEEDEMKKPYQLIAQENKPEKPINSETKI